MYGAIYFLYGYRPAVDDHLDDPRAETFPVHHGGMWRIYPCNPRKLGLRVLSPTDGERAVC